MCNNTQKKKAAGAGKDFTLFFGVMLHFNFKCVQNRHDALGLSEKPRCLSFPSAFLALQPGGFVQREGRIANSLLVCYVCF